MFAIWPAVPQPLVHLSPLGWEHLNLTGDYICQANRRVAKGHFRHLGNHGRLRFPGLKLCKQTLSVRKFPFPELTRDSDEFLTTSGGALKPVTQAFGGYEIPVRQLHFG